MNANKVVTDGFSNPDSEFEFQNGYPSDSKARELAAESYQCGGCSYFAPLNADYGMCCNSKSPCHLETVFEHFTCSEIDIESWAYHSFGNAGSITTAVSEAELNQKIWQVAEHAVMQLQTNGTMVHADDVEGIIKMVYRLLDNKVKFFYEV
jgi:hypothetical protein